MSVDFCQLKLKINYNNSGNPYLQYGPNTGVQPPQEFQAGWNEVYDFPSPPGANQSTPNQTIQQSAANAFNLLAARASLLALNFYIFSAEIHQASIFKSSLPLPGSARFGGIDASYSLTVATVDAPGYAGQLCSNPEETVIIRQESVGLRRWERQIRGIKDYVSDDSMSEFAASSWGPTQSTLFDAVVPTIQIPGTAAGTAGVINFANVGGVLQKTGSGITSAGNYVNAAAGTYPLSITDPTGSGAYGTFTITGTAITAVSFTSGGAGYTSPVVTAPVTADPGGIGLYQTVQTLWANFAACLQAYTGSGQHQRVANPSFPSGYMTQLNSTSPLSGFYPTQRVLIQRIGNRQTGQIRTTSKARVKRGI